MPAIAEQQASFQPQVMGSFPTKEEEKDPIAKERECKFVEKILDEIKKDRHHTKDAFETMQKDMAFARGIQWEGQQSLLEQRYVCNLVQRALSQRVALLYAKNPTITYERRDRLDFEVWDGKVESIMAAHQEVNMSILEGKEVSPLGLAMIKDYSEGELWREQIDRVGKTVTFVAQWCIDNLKPEFKIQMKQAVRRVGTCGVAFVKTNYVDGLEGGITTSETESTLGDRAKRLSYIAQQLQDDKLKESDPKILELAMLGESIQTSLKTGDTQNINQRITFDFLPPTSVIVDRNCRALKGFVGARHIAIEYIKDLEQIKILFNKPDIKADEIKASYEQGSKGQSTESKNQTSESDKGSKKVCIFEVYDLDTKSVYYLLDGYKYFLEEPTSPVPELNAFFPLDALTFNDIEADPSADCHNSIYPPSDVSLMRPSQIEWNRSRWELIKHRYANRPRYFATKGVLTEEDKDKINDYESNAVIELAGGAGTIPLKDIVMASPMIPIQPSLYDTSPLVQDIQLSAGSQEADMGRPSPRVTATGATIAEQSRNTVAASNIDDLDDFLSSIAGKVGEIIIRYFQLDTVKRIAGRGAVLPQENREDFINEILLTIKAGSSGKPNEALEVSKRVQLAPFLIQSGANPIAVIEDLVSVMDSRLDVSKFFPVGGAPTNGGSPQQSGQPQRPQVGVQKNHPQQLPNGSPVHEQQIQ